MAVHVCTPRSPLTGCQVTARPHHWFPIHSKWTDTFWTDLVFRRAGIIGKTGEQEINTDL
jgi:hypothetical protein